MSKRDIILFDIGRKTTGFSEKNLRRKLRTSSEPIPQSHFHPSFILRSAHRTNQSFFHWFPYGVYYDRPSCIFSNGATHPGIELALSSAARSGSGYYLENPYLNENHSHLAPYNTFLSKCQGFFWPFLPSFFGYFS